MHIRANMSKFPRLSSANTARMPTLTGDCRKRKRGCHHEPIVPTTAQALISRMATLLQINAFVLPPPNADCLSIRPLHNLSAPKSAYVG